MLRSISGRWKKDENSHADIMGFKYLGLILAYRGGLLYIYLDKIM